MTPQHSHSLRYICDTPLPPRSTVDTRVTSALAPYGPPPPLPHTLVFPLILYDPRRGCGEEIRKAARRGGQEGKTRGKGHQGEYWNQRALPQDWAQFVGRRHKMAPNHPLFLLLLYFNRYYVIMSTTAT
ncbi:hypothetical protein J6590_054763 [Homalodisca vitripennis]|nr:hypothetical protein J6590_054763 [Homalodisca vitripennis]